MNYDAERRALLLERLGRQLVGLGAPVVEQMEIICALLGQLWSVPADGVPLPTLDEKGRWLVAFIAQSWEELNRPCPTAVVERALTYGERRLASFDASRAVLAHGDAHAWNTLEDLVPTQPGAFRLIDPDGLLAEPEYDLSILLREFTEELLAGDALTLGRARARYLATHTGLSEQKIWEWGYIERVANGLLCLKEGHVDLGRECLHVAELWNQVD
jgi:streptomycin 6-kinase